MAYSGLLLNPAHREIRLLTVPAGQCSDEIRCDLHVSSLDQEPLYKTLSYTWGSESNKQVIYINSHRFEVTRNLERALRRIRKPDAGLTLWIDAICIDQTNKDEVNHQVSIMKDIYQSCEEVIIWIEDSEAEIQANIARPLRSWSGSNSDMTILDLYRQDFDGDGKSLRLRLTRVIDYLFHAFCFIRLLAADEHFTKLAPFVDVGDEAYHKNVMQALSSFIGSPWFNRIWVVQEAILPPKTTCVYGPMTFPLDLLMEAAENFTVHTNSCCLKEYSAHIQKGNMKVLPHFANVIHELISRKKNWLAGDKTVLWLMCSSYRKRQASKDHDKVYGVLGLVRDWGKCGPIVPNYRLSVSQVYQQVVLNNIRDLGALFPFYWNLEKQGHPELPSWVVDWTNTTDLMEHVHLQQIMMYNATRYSSADPKLYGDTTLVISGIYVDKIRAVGEVMATVLNEIDPPQRKTFSQWMRFAEVAGRNKDLRRPYHSGCTFIEAFWRTLCNDTVFDPGAYGVKTWLKCSRAVPADEDSFASWAMHGNTSPFWGNGLTAEERAPFLNDPRFNLPSDKMGTDYNDKARAIGNAIAAATIGRRIFLTEKGYLGIGPAASNVDDEVYLLIGGRTPFVIHRTDGHAVPEKGMPPKPLFRLHGACYIHGIMDGEAMDRNKLEDIYLE